MRCCRNAERSAPFAWHAAWITALSLLLPALSSPGASTAHTGSGFHVRHASIRLVEGVYLLDADIAFDFSTEALDAMENGVPITVLVDMEIRRERRAWLDEKVAAVQARYRIENHPLTGRYVVRNLSTGELRAFTDFDEMTDEVGRITDFPMLDRHLLEAGQRYTVRVRARLDIESLPSPLRPLAYLSSRWRQKSDWYEWEIEP